MTSWKRAKDKQHQELRTPKYRQRVVPVVRNEKLKEAEEREILEELMKLETNESDD